ncbi:MAG: hypothetical protein KF784_11545 [Fimbriimonadaceae bacterium]|nr:hypothetical protein [Fimbriimonadaceae bacterium]
MILCLFCFRLWPKSAKFCGNCTRSFGCRLCSKGHRSPSVATVCVECASKDLSKPGRYLSLRPLSLVLALGLIFLGLKFTVANFGSISALAYQVADGVFGFVSGIGIARAVASIFNFLIILALPFVLGWILFERGKRPSVCLQAYWRLVGALSRLFVRSFSFVAKAVFAPQKRDKSKSKRKEP